MQQQEGFQARSESYRGYVVQRGRVAAHGAVANLPQPGSSHVVKRREQRGLVRRNPLEGDGRITVATLTEQGHAFMIDAVPAHVEKVREYVIDALTSEQLDQLKEISRQAARIEADRAG
ncbi:hypothetical protein [Kribbella sp. NPDC051770]|uniref:MarR family winged helix-turn-helix transcriptional regulator n=1 Tax=Kribbella sp. NPDC051770 TaxID=3155413 RepID=UPI003439DBA5